MVPLNLLLAASLDCHACPVYIHVRINIVLLRLHHNEYLIHLVEFLSQVLMPTSLASAWIVMVLRSSGQRGVSQLIYICQQYVSSRDSAV